MPIFLPQTKVVSLHKRFGPLGVQQPDQKTPPGFPTATRKEAFWNWHRRQGRTGCDYRQRWDLARYAPCKLRILIQLVSWCDESWQCSGNMGWTGEKNGDVTAVKSHGMFRSQWSISEDALRPVWSQDWLPQRGFWQCHGPSLSLTMSVVWSPFCRRWPSHL